jgi:hypothetical protein
MVSLCIVGEALSRIPREYPTGPTMRLTGGYIRQQTTGSGHRDSVGPRPFAYQAMLLSSPDIRCRWKNNISDGFKSLSNRTIRRSNQNGNWTLQKWRATLDTILMSNRVQPSQCIIARNGVDKGRPQLYTQRQLGPQYLPMRVGLLWSRTT